MGQMKKKDAFFGVTAVILQWTAALLAGVLMVKNGGYLYDIVIQGIAVNNVKSHFPDPTLFTLFYIKKLLVVFFVSYAVPVFMFLVPGMLSVTFILRNNIVNTQWKSSGFVRCWLPVMCAVAALFLVMVIFNGPMNKLVLPVDQYSYVFQSNIIAQGKLFVDSPRPGESFLAPQVINRGKWYSKYTVGWPLLLASVAVTGFFSMLTGLLCAGVVYLLHLFCLKFFDRQTALLVPFLFLLSPMLTFTGADLTPHMAISFFSLLAVYSLLKGIESKAVINFFVCAFSIMMVIIIRPVDGFLVTGSVFVFLMIELFQKKISWKEVIKAALWWGGGCIVSCVILGIVNQVQNNNPFLFSFLVYNPEEKYGFGIYGHTPLAGVWNSLFSIFRIQMWNFPLFLETAILCLFVSKNSKYKLPWVFFGVYLAFFFGYYSEGGASFGYRYLTVPVVFMLMASAGGIVKLMQIAGKKKFGAGALVSLVSVFLITVAVIYPHCWKNTQRYIAPISHYYSKIASNDSGSEKKIFFIAYADNLFTYNMPKLNSKSIRVLLLTPEVNQKVLSLHPSRKPFICFKDAVTGKLKIVPYPANLKPGPLYGYMLFQASQNYLYRLRDTDTARRCLKDSQKLLANNPWSFFQLGMLEFINGKYEASRLNFLEYVRKTPGPASVNTYYYLGRIACEKNEYLQAIKCFNVVTSKLPTDSSMYEQAVWWKKFAREKAEKARLKLTD